VSGAPGAELMGRDGSRGRLEIVDFLRGVAIIEMMAAHYVGYLPSLIGKIVDYTETAMALFVLLAGFMVGWGYRKFERKPREETLILWRRGLRVLAVQFIIILTVGVPLYFLGMPGVRGDQSLTVFVLQSMAFLNQIGLIHILPTFIPLFAVAPAILWGFTKGKTLAVLLVSFVVFCVGHFNPYVLDLGQPTIFPFVLFQLYFVVGCLFGKHAQVTGTLAPEHPTRWLWTAIALLLATMLLFHGKVLPSRLVSIHPLNIFGLMYHAPIIMTICFIALVFWPRIRRLWAYPFVARFGRHALLVFVIHLYLAKLLGVMNYLALVPMLLNCVLIVASVAVISETLKLYERSLALAQVPIWARWVHVLFR
jgi:hypothetical protein